MAKALKEVLKRPWQIMGIRSDLSAHLEVSASAFLTAWKILMRRRK